MSESICLHIQEHETGPIRIVEVPWISVRIGKAAFCEVRLTDPDLPDEVCRLHRRGRTWCVAPAPGAPGAALATLDGVAINSTRPLPFDVPLRIGRHRLSLKRSRLAEPDWRAPRPVVEAIAEPRPFAPEPDLSNPWEARWRAAGERLKATAAARKAVDKTASAPRVPLVEPARAEAPPPPPRVPKTEFRPPAVDRPELGRAPFDPPQIPKTRPAPPIAPAPTPVSAPTPAPTPPTHPAPPIDPRAKADLLARLESLDLESLQSGVEEEKAADPEPTGFEPPQDAPTSILLLLGEASQRPGEDREVCDDASALPACEPNPLQDPTTREQEEDAPPSVLLPPGEEAQRPDEGLGVCGDASALPSREPNPLRDPTTPTQPFGPPSLEETGEIDFPPTRGQDAPKDVEPDPKAEPIELQLPPPPKPSPAPMPEPEPEPEPEPKPEPRVEAEQIPARAERWVEEEIERLERDDLGEPEPEPIDRRPERFDPTRAPRSRPDALPTLPSVQDVLDASLWRRRDEAQTLPRPPKRAARARPAMVPTTPVEPPHWSPPTWLVWPPAAFFTAAVAAVFTLCSWWMAVDSYNASIAIRSTTAARLGLGKDRPLPESAVPPPLSWWRTTPLHLAEWAVHINGTRVEHGFAETPADLIAGAEAISPLNAMARLVGARLADAAAANGSVLNDAKPAARLGLSRDAVSLALTARTLHRAGQSPAAVSAYRRALEIAARTESTHDSSLVFCDDPNVPRYLLPGEAKAAAIVREMAEDPSWTPADWIEAIPEANLATLAAARVLKELGRSEADLLLKRIVERLETEAEAQSGSDSESGFDPEWIERAGADGFAESLRHAILAEARALQGDWRGAERHYKAAVAVAGDPRIRRSWWFNLADIAGRLNDEKQRGAALDEALAALDGGDDVSRRAMDLQRVAGPSGRIRPTPIKAN